MFLITDTHYSQLLENYFLVVFICLPSTSVWRVINDDITNMDGALEQRGTRAVLH